MEESTGPTSKDWKLAVVALRLMDDLGDEDFREELGQLARTLTVEGLSAHRTADHLEKRSAFTTTLSPSDHEVEAIWARVSQSCQEKHWRRVGAYIARLGSGGLDDLIDFASKRRRSSTLLSSSTRSCSEIRLASIGTRALTNDTIISIMLDWNVQPTDTAGKLTAHGYRPDRRSARARAGARSPPRAL